MTAPTPGPRTLADQIHACADQLTPATLLDRPNIVAATLHDLAEKVRESEAATTPPGETRAARDRLTRFADPGFPMPALTLGDLEAITASEARRLVDQAMRGMQETLAPDLRTVLAALAETEQRDEQAETERQRFARVLADRQDEYDSVESERVRLATELGALDAERAALQLAQDDLQAAYDRLGEQARRITEAAKRFRAERDELRGRIEAARATADEWRKFALRYRDEPSRAAQAAWRSMAHALCCVLTALDGTSTATLPPWPTDPAPSAHDGPQRHAQRPAGVETDAEPRQDAPGPQEPAHRHTPLTDEPSGVIPTEAGLDYLKLRRQQHPKTEAVTCPNCDQDVYLEANGTIGSHPLPTNLVTGPHGNLITCPATGSKPKAAER